MTVGIMMSLCWKLLLLAATFTVISVLTERWWKSQYPPAEGPVYVHLPERWLSQRKSA